MTIKKWMISLACLGGIIDGGFGSSDSREDLAITKSFRPKEAPVIEEGEYSPYQHPEGTLCFDDQRNMYAYVEGFSLISQNRLTTSSLAVNSVGTHSYQYAFFATPNYLDNRQLKFNLIPSENNTYRIQCNSGATSHLAVSDIGRNSYQYALFATEGYLLKNGCSYEFIKDSAQRDD
jgi:hypothetical protein